MTKKVTNSRNKGPRKLGLDSASHGKPEFQDNAKARVGKHQKVPLREVSNMA